MIIKTLTHDHEQDLSTILQLWNANAIEMASEALTPQDIQAIQTQLLTLMKSPYANVIVAKKNNVVIGYATMTIHHDLAEDFYYGLVNELFVIATNRRSGVASHLITASKEWFVTKNIEAVQIYVALDNPKAVEAFKANGFTPEFTLLMND